MDNGKSMGGGRILNVVLLLCDIALLVWIVVSWRGQNKPQPTSDYYSGLGYDVSGVTGTDGGSSSGISSVGVTSSGSSSDSGASSGTESLGGTQTSDSWMFSGEPSSSGELQTDGGQTVSGQSAGTSSASYSTTERPEATDFDSWKTHGGAVPSGAEILTDFGAVSGSWKGFIQYDMAEELVNFTISPSQSGADLTVDWYLIHYFGDGSWMNEEDMGDVVWSGSWSDGTLAVSGAVSLTFRAFYETGGQQFAVGEMTLADGSSAVVGMVRP